tara:strand:- start:1800 stop:2288 length:489 start_codon:yes stop_codon:yes gene_type:complete
MRNVGVFDGDLIAIWILALLFPMFFYKAVQIYDRFKYGSSESEYHPILMNGVPVEDVPVDNTQVEPINEWEQIKQAAIQRAIEGDKSARDWVTKHVFNDGLQPDSSPQFSSGTNHQIMRDALDCLKGLGYKVSDLKRVIKELCVNNTYTTVEDLVQDVIKNC